MNPHISTVTVYSDRYVTFEQYTFSIGIFLYICKLLVKMELDEIVLADLVVAAVAGSAETVQKSMAVLSLFPLVEICRAVFVTQVAIESVWFQP